MARKRSTRTKANQQARTQYLGREAETVRSYGWRKRAVLIMRGLRMDRSMQDLALKALGAVEAKRGGAYLDRQSDKMLRATLRSFRDSFKADPDLLSTHHKRPGVSGIYKMSGDLRVRSGLERPQDIRQADRPPIGDENDPANIAYLNAPEPKHTVGLPASSKQLRLNLAHLTTQNLSAEQLRTHEHPDVRKLFSAIDPSKAKFQRDNAVVWSADNKLFYILGKITRHVHVDPNAPKDQFNLLMPRAMDYRNNRQAIPLNRLDDYGSETKWRTVLHTKDMFKMTDPATGKEIVAKGKLDNIIVKWQKRAWEEAKPFYETYMDYKVHKKGALRLRKMYTPPGVAHELEMSDDDKRIYDYAFHVWKNKEDMLRGRMPEGEFASDEDRDAHAATLAHLGTSYTWYLWLLASEQAYGVRLPERQALPENHLRPHESSAVVGRKLEWPIQPVGREPVARWDTTALEKTGILGGNIVKFHKDLENSPYKLTNQGDKAITHLWIPLVGDLWKKWKLDTHPAAISDYLASAKRHPETIGHIAGEMGGKLHPRQPGLSIQQYTFEAGTPQRSFSLVPAIGYLQYFDSPAHGGDRLVHGQGIQRAKYEPEARKAKALEPPKEDTAMSRRARQHRELVGKKPAFQYDPLKRKGDLDKIAANLADKILLQQRLQTAKEKETISRIRQRATLNYMDTQGQDRRPWRAPKKREGFIPAPFQHIRYNDLEGTLPPSKAFGRETPVTTTTKTDYTGKFINRPVWHDVALRAKGRKLGVTPIVVRRYKNLPSGERVQIAIPPASSQRTNIEVPAGQARLSGRPQALRLGDTQVRPWRVEPHRRFEIKPVGPSVPAKASPPVVKHELLVPRKRIVALSWEKYWADVQEAARKRPKVIDGKTYGVEQVLRDEEEYRQRYQERLEAFIKQQRRRGYMIYDDMGNRLG